MTWLGGEGTQFNRGHCSPDCVCVHVDVYSMLVGVRKYQPVL